MKSMNLRILEYYDPGYDRDGPPATASFHSEFLPGSALVELQLSRYYELSPRSSAQIYFTECTYNDANGNFHKDPLLPVVALGRNNLSSYTGMVEIKNCTATFILNMFFWDNVS